MCNNVLRKLYCNIYSVTRLRILLLSAQDFLFPKTLKVFGLFPPMELRYVI